MQPPAVPPSRRACVIGAGLGGLALAIRLQAAGVATTLIEAREELGGLAGGFVREGFTFDSGPAALPDPAALGELWALTGHAMVDDVTLLPIAPLCRFNWQDGTTFDYAADPAALEAEVARIAPGDLAGFQDFMAWCARVHEEVWLKFGRTPLGHLPGLAAIAPALARLQAWRNAWSAVARFVRNEKLREVLTAHLVEVGGNPFTASAVHALHHRRLARHGLWYPQGGFVRLAEALGRQFERIGGTLRRGDPVTRIETLGNRVSEVVVASGWRERFDAVASNADLVHTYRQLLEGTGRGAEMGRQLVRKTWSPSAFVLHFGVEGTWPGIPHRLMLFGPRYREYFADIHEHGVLPRDLMISLHHPSVTDPSLAPGGKSCFTAAVPVANRAKLPIDWEQLGPLLEQRVLAEVGRRLIPDLDDRIVTKEHVTPRDLALEFNAHAGSGYSLQPIFAQSGWLRPHNRDAKLRNFYLAGAGTHPGAGLPGVIASAKASAQQMLEDLA